MKSQTRPYRQRTRASTTEATRRRIVDAAIDLFTERWYDDVGLREIAARAGVALQTVVNHFGTKEALFMTGLEDYHRDRLAARDGAGPDDPAAAAAAIVADYEQVGASNLRALALEERVPALQQALTKGRESHREWVQLTFPGALAGLAPAERERRVAQLAVATDVYSWRLLRHDHGLDRAQTVSAVQALVERLYDEPPKGAS